MPYSYEVDRGARIAYVRAWGALDLDETLKAPRALGLHPDYDTKFGVVGDLRDIRYEPSARDVGAGARNLIRLRKQFEYRVGLVVSRKLALASELSAAIAQAGGFPIRIFADLDEAFGWVRPGQPDGAEPPAD